jgi:hypothetical protein
MCRALCFSSTALIEWCVRGIASHAEEVCDGQGEIARDDLMPLGRDIHEVVGDIIVVKSTLGVGARAMRNARSTYPNFQSLNVGQLAAFGRGRALFRYAKDEGFATT